MSSRFIRKTVRHPHDGEIEKSNRVSSQKASHKTQKNKKMTRFFSFVVVWDFLAHVPNEKKKRS